jgi:hypothetical protein
MPVVSEPVDAKIDGSIFRLVSDFLFYQEIDHRDHFGDVFRFGGGGIEVSVFNSQGAHVLKESGRKFFGELGQRNIGSAAIADRFIVNIGDVHHAVNGVAPGFEMPLQQVFEEISTEVADMGKRINCRPAGIHLNHFSCRIERLERFHCSRKAINKPNHEKDLNSPQRHRGHEGDR